MDLTSVAGGRTDPRRLVPRPRRAPALGVLLACLSVLVLTGCSEDALKPSADTINQNKPNANDRILAQVKFGGANTASSIWDMRSIDGTSFPMDGEMDGAAVAGGLGATGGVVWHRTLVFHPYGMAMLAAASPTPGGTIVVGGEDTNADGYNEVGHAMLFSPSGSPVNEIRVGGDTTSASLNDITVLSDSEFVAAGWKRVNGYVRPLLVRLVVTGADTLAERSEVELTDLMGRHALDVAADPTDAPGPTRRLYLSTRVSGGPAVITVHGVDVDAGALAPASVAWTREIIGEGLNCYARDVVARDGAAYVLGYQQDPAKTPRPSGADAYWISGLAVRLTRDGDVAWERNVGPTRQGDSFESAVPTATGLQCVGVAGGYGTSVPGATYSFGYGWVSCLALADGTPQTHYLFGDVSWASGFNTVVWTDGACYLGGWCDETAEGGLRGWWCKVNVGSGTPPLAASSAVIPGARARPLAERKSAPRWGR